MIPGSQAIRWPDRRSMVATELHAGQQAGAALASSTPRPEPMIWFRPAAPEIPIEWLLRLIPEAEAKLYGVLTELIPAPSMVAPNLACRQIKMAKLAKLAGLSRRWVIMLLVRLEERAHSHPGRERRGEMDLAAFPRRPPPREGIAHRAHAEREEPGTKPGDSESSPFGRPAKAPVHL